MDYVFHSEMSMAVENSPLPRRDDKSKTLTYRSRTAVIKTENLPRRYRTAFKINSTATAPPPRRLLEKCFIFSDCNCFGLELFSLIDHIRRIPL
jgi:hypothetical protein